MNWRGENKELYIYMECLWYSYVGERDQACNVRIM